MATQTSPAAPAVGLGAVLGGFRLASVVGEGGMGIVFRGENVRVPSLVRAVKVVRPALASDPAFRARFLREAELTEVLRHPNILRIENVAEEGGVLFMVMELLEGRPADALLRAEGAGLPIPEAVRILVEALTGLAHAHRHGVVHRDLKPANLFVTTGGEVKLLDFGIAKGETGERLTSTGMATPGTPEYYAPEFASGAPATPASDIYAMGVTLFELLAGAPPYMPGGGTTQQAALSVLLQHVTTPMPDVRTRRPEVPPELAEIVKRATEKDPAARHPDAEAFARALDRFAGTAPLRAARGAGPERPATTPATTPITAPPTRRGRRAPVVAALLLLAAAGGGAALWLRQPGRLV